jgi:hypothetical protein
VLRVLSAELRRRLLDLLLAVGGLVAAGAAATALLLFLCVHMPGESWSGPVEPAEGEQAELAGRLREHVEVLATGIGERHYRALPKLQQAADYVEASFTAAGYVPASQVFGGPQFRNLSVDLYGGDLRGEIIVVGAHYDTENMTPGADDNASGVAGLLELARALRAERPRRTIRFIAFANEEAPFFGREDMGSRVSARRSAERGENIVGMFSLEMIGYYSDAPRSQYRPRSVRRFYPNTGNFIAFVSDFSSRPLLQDALLAFRSHARLPSEGLNAPTWLVPAVNRSDNSSYSEFGYPAVMITDTGDFRNMGYHNVGDVARTLNYDYMAHVVNGVRHMLLDLANR